MRFEMEDHLSPPGDRCRYAAGKLKRIEHPTAQKHRRGQRLEVGTRVRCLDSMLDRHLIDHILDRDIAQSVIDVSMLALRNRSRYSGDIHGRIHSPANSRESKA